MQVGITMILWSFWNTRNTARFRSTFPDNVVVGTLVVFMGNFAGEGTQQMRSQIVHAIVK